MWIPAFAGMTEYLNADFRLCGNNAYALSQTFFHHNLLAPEAICSSDAGKSTGKRVRIVNSNRFRWSYPSLEAGITT